MPRNLTALTHVESFYNAVGLPGCCGSVDVVHVKWSNCTAGDFNRAKGKEFFPSLGFQCIIDFNRRILSIYGPHFGSRNNMDIVKTDKNVNAMRNNQLFCDVQWAYYGHNGHVWNNHGMYLIRDNGYLRWPMTICPFKRTDIGSPEEYFSTLLEGVWKDVECMFGILKKRWQILNNGFFHREAATRSFFCTFLFSFARTSERVGPGGSFVGFVR